jgi:hypothetical protein
MLKEITSLEIQENIREKLSTIIKSFKMAIAAESG